MLEFSTTITVSLTYNDSILLNIVIYYPETDFLINDTTNVGSEVIAYESWDALYADDRLIIDFDERGEVNEMSVLRWRYGVWQHFRKERYQNHMVSRRQNTAICVYAEKFA